MRDYKIEIEKRVEFIRGMLKDAGAKGIVFGNSGGKDCALAGILCKMACEDTVGVIMPCGVKQNYESDRTDAEKLAKQYDIESRYVELTQTRDELVGAMRAAEPRTKEIRTYDKETLNVAIAPRLRMIVLFTIATSENRLVCGTGNRSEIYMGYFTKWGDGAYDFNPVADLTVTEIYEFLEYLRVNEPSEVLSNIIDKVPSGGLFEGQTDENEMGVPYSVIDKYLLGGEIDTASKEIMTKFHTRSEHKRQMPKTYSNYTEEKR